MICSFPARCRICKEPFQAVRWDESVCPSCRKSQRRAMMRTVGLTAVVAALLLGCTTAQPPRSLEQRAIADVRTVDALYISTLTAAGDLHSAH